MWRSAKRVLWWLYLLVMVVVALGVALGYRGPLGRRSAAEQRIEDYHALCARLWKEAGPPTQDPAYRRVFLQDCGAAGGEGVDPRHYSGAGTDRPDGGRRRP